MAWRTEQEKTEQLQGLDPTLWTRMGPPLKKPYPKKKTTKNCWIKLFLHSLFAVISDKSIHSKRLRLYKVMKDRGMLSQSVGTGLWTVEGNILPHSDPYLALG